MKATAILTLFVLLQSCQTVTPCGVITDAPDLSAQICEEAEVALRVWEEVYPQLPTPKIRGIKVSVDGRDGGLFVLEHPTTGEPVSGYSTFDDGGRITIASPIGTRLCMSALKHEYLHQFVHQEIDVHGDPFHTLPVWNVIDSVQCAEGYYDVR